VLPARRGGDRSHRAHVHGKHGGRFDANQEFLALSASNLASGIGRGFPISGGMSQSLVNEGGGAQTPLSVRWLQDHFGGRPVPIPLLSALPQPC